MIRYTIHQIKSSRDTKRFIFSGSDSLLREKDLSFPPPKELYDEIYSDKQEVFDPEKVFAKFNTAHPNDYKGRSLSVSDVLQYHLNGNDSLWLFCDSFGYCAIDFRPEYKVARKSEYNPGSQSNGENITLFYKTADKLRTVTVDISLLNPRRKIGIDQDNNEVVLTPGEIYNVQLTLVSGREKLRAKEYIKSLKGWQESGIPSFGDYVFPGEPVTDSFVKYYTDILPPTIQKPGYLQAGGECCQLKDVDGKYKPCYLTFVRHDNVWFYAGICFFGKAENQKPLYTFNQRIDDFIF